MLVKIHTDGSSKPRSKSHFNAFTGLENMTITYFHELCLFQQHIDHDSASLTVQYCPPESEHKSLEMPLVPCTDDLEVIDIMLHQSPTKGFAMGEETNAWFSECLSCEVKLVYLGPNTRHVLGTLAPDIKVSKPQSWLSSVTSFVPGITPQVQGAKVGFSDIAPYLVVTEESLKEVSTRLADGIDMDVTKFRPNIVISGESAAYDEDFWAALTINNSTRTEEYAPPAQILLTGNCGRCSSINVDYDTGATCQGDDGKVLKKMMNDRRVDPGMKYSPIFGRYGFLDPTTGGQKHQISIGDEVTVSKRNTGRTVFGECIWSSDLLPSLIDKWQIGLDWGDLLDNLIDART